MTGGAVENSGSQKSLSTIYFAELFLSFLNCSRFYPAVGDTSWKQLQEHSAPCKPTVAACRAARAAAMAPARHRAPASPAAAMCASSSAPRENPGTPEHPGQAPRAAPTGMGRQQGWRMLLRSQRSREGTPCPSCGTSCSGCTRACPTSWSCVSNSSCST